MEPFLYLCHDLKLSVPVVKGCWVAFNHVFSLTGIDLTSISVVCHMFCSFEKFCLPRVVWPLDWNISLVLSCLSILSWPQISTSPGRPPFCLLSCRPKGLVTCTASPIVFSILGVERPASSLSFLTSMPRPRILLCLTHRLMSSPFHPWLILWTVIKMNSCSTLSKL